MAERFGYREGDFPSPKIWAARIGRAFSGVMTEKQVELVCNAIREELSKA